MTFDETTGFGAGGAGFGLSHDGEELVLSYLPGTAQDRIVDSVRFKAQEQGISLGRYPDGGAYWFRLTPSRGTANKNPVLDVVINEIMYHPVDPNEEYIELYNPTTKSVALRSTAAAWRLDGAVELRLPRRSIDRCGQAVGDRRFRPCRGDRPPQRFPHRLCARPR